MTDMATAEPATAIVLEGVRVHNLKSIDVAIPRNRLTVVTGVSGSGKSSLAFDTLYAEGQRRYIESFSPSTRLFLERLDKPDADRIDHLPPAIALRQNSIAPGRRATVATVTEIYDYLRLVFARAGRIVDPHTGREIRRDSPESVARLVERLPPQQKLLIAFPLVALAVDDGPERPSTSDRLIDVLLDRGFTRLICDNRLWNVAAGSRPDLSHTDAALRDAAVVVDRLVTGRIETERLAESLETAFDQGEGRCLLIVEGRVEADRPEQTTSIDGSDWCRLEFERRLVSPATGHEFLEPTPGLFRFHSPLGACPECRGSGNVAAMSWDKLVPDSSKTLREGAIAAWTTPAYRHELDELIALADDYEIPLDVPFAELDARHKSLIDKGVPERNFGGMRGFFRWLERKRYKIGVAAFLARFRDYYPCPSCGGDRLNAAALAVRIGTQNIADYCRQPVERCLDGFDDFDAAAQEAAEASLRSILPEIRGRLETMTRLGLGYLELDRTTATLSGGESRRVALTAAAGAGLVNMLYVLDEPTAGLHPHDRDRLVDVLSSLRNAPNTVVVVEHDLQVRDAADWVIDLGPGAGRDGGRVVYSGPASGGRRPSENAKSETRGADAPRSPEAGELLTLAPCTRHNLKGFAVDVPLNRLCAVSGVSGSGKSTLVVETLYPAVCRSLGKPCDLDDFDHDAVADTQDRFDDVVLMTATPIGRTPRSNPATYLGAFDAIRTAFAATPEAKLRALGPATFSFNSSRGGRCPHCNGAGTVSIDMQFLPDIEVVCPECRGRRFRRDVLEIKLRGLSIAEVLGMTAAEAFVFFRNHPKVQKRLAPLKEVGLDYLPLGQSATTLSGGESQRLKIASFLGSGKGRRCLFLFDEPTVGLHAADVDRLLACFRRLIAVGHSLVVVDHRVELLRAADWIIDLGPAAGENGGRIVASGPPSAIAAVPESITGRYLTP